MQLTGPWNKHAASPAVSAYLQLGNIRDLQPAARGALDMSKILVEMTEKFVFMCIRSVVFRERIVAKTPFACYASPSIGQRVTVSVMVAKCCLAERPPCV